MTREDFNTLEEYFHYLDVTEDTEVYEWTRNVTPAPR